MSIALLGLVYDDMRRIAVAGSAVAPGDFRLKKHVAPLEAAGAKAPIFLKVAEQVKAVVESTETSSPQAVLELASLLNAVLYTLGETGSPGSMEEIETTELDLAGAAQVGARTLKPLFEALGSTGSGRFEFIKEAHERGAFQDLRLVKPSLAALDDGYGEIAEFVAEKVLPLYGRAILPELRAKLDVKGKAGHARRLKLLHRLDPAGTRERVKQALDGGSKDVRVAAIECLGTGPDDLPYLIEQSSAKAQDVRRAAYLALATLDDPAAVDVLAKAMAGKEAETATPALANTKNAVVIGHLVATIRSQVATLKSTEDKKTVGTLIHRLQTLLQTLWNRDDARVEKLLLDLFRDRSALDKVKGETDSGVDLNRAVNAAMVHGSRATQEAFAAVHDTLAADELGNAFLAARMVWPAARLLKEFGPYLRSEGKVGKKDANRRDAVLSALTGQPYQRHLAGFLDQAEPTEALPLLHPDWLDSVIAIGHVESIAVLGRPGHAAQNTFLRKAFDEKIAGKNKAECQPVVSAMVQLQHPDATDCLVTAVETLDKKSYWSSYYYEWLIPELPESAIPKLEELIPKLGERDADRWMDRLEQLRAKHRTSHGQESRDG